MREEASRADATAEHKARCEQKLAVLMEQKKDLSMALDQLLSDIRDGKKYMKVYKQMKMYNQWLPKRSRALRLLQKMELY